MHFYFLLILLAAQLSCSNKPDKPSKEGVRVVKRGLSHPWEITWGKDNHIWMTERDGTVSRINPANGQTTFSFKIKEVDSRGEGGLLGLALHPSFKDNGWIYVVYNYKGKGGYREKLVRYTYENSTLSSPFVLLDGIDAAGIHNGSRLWITQESTPRIFISTGDAADKSSPQQTNNLNGKILRLNMDGSIPSDNPLPNNPVWSYGHRNAQGLVFANGILYASEHGPDVEDEVNIIEKFRNYGWPEVTGPCKSNDKRFCSNHDVKEPIWSSGDGTIAVCGLDYYNNDLIPQWKNSLLMMTLKNSSIVQLKLGNDKRAVVETRTWFSNEWGRLRDICISPDGRVFVCSSNGNDDVIVEITKL